MSNYIDYLLSWINENILAIIYRSHEIYWNGNLFFLVIYIVSLTILLASDKKKSKGKRLFAYFSLIALLLFCYNPFINLVFLMLPDSSEAVYSRVWIFLPVWMVMAFAITELAERVKSIFVRSFICFCIAIGIAFTGVSLDYSGYFCNTTSVYKVNEDGIQIADTILSSNDNSAVGMLMFCGEEERIGNYYRANSIYYSIKQYTSQIRVIPVYYEEQEFEEYYLSDVLPDGESLTMDYVNEVFSDFRRNYDFSYVIIPEDYSLRMSMAYSGYELINSVNGNDIYLAKPRWYIQSFSYLMEDNTKVYIIADNSGHFVVIGGGSQSDRRQLQKVMNYCGNHVDCWIITAPSADALEGFNCIVSTEGFTVDNVLMPAIDTDSLYSGFMDDRDVEAYEEFINLSNSGLFNLSYVVESDDIDVYGMNIQILSDMLNVQSGNVTENSMLFQAIIGDKSFLFCSYIGFEQGQVALDKYDEALDSDYVQIASGSGTGLSQEFYETVSPDIAFCDSIRDDAGCWTYKQLISLGVKCFCNENGDQSMVIIE